MLTASPRRRWRVAPGLLVEDGERCRRRLHSGGRTRRGTRDHTTAFARYERRLRPYIKGAQKQAASSQAFLAPPTWKKIRQRNRFYKMPPYLPVSGLISRAATKTATAITLPSYAQGPA